LNASCFGGGRHLFFKDFDGIILVHDLTNNKSKSKLDHWLAEIEDAYIAAGCDGSESDVASFIRIDTSDHIPSQTAPHVTSFHHIPKLFIGTKLDQMPHGYTSSYPRDEPDCEYLDVSCTQPRIEWEKIQGFYNLLIQRKFFSSRQSKRGSMIQPSGGGSYSRTSGRRSTEMFSAPFGGGLSPSGGESVPRGRQGSFDGKAGGYTPPL